MKNWRFLTNNISLYLGNDLQYTAKLTMADE